jgi:hypothetical protein
VTVTLRLDAERPRCIAPLSGATRGNPFKTLREVLIGHTSSAGKFSKFGQAMDFKQTSRRNPKFEIRN